MKKDYSGDKYVYSGIGFIDLLGIVFIVLKLCHVINWSWWIVLLPIWLPFVFSLAVILIAVIFALFVNRDD